MRLFKLTLLALLLPLTMMAQKTEIGLYAGLQSYQGDLAEADFTLKGSSYAVGLLLKQHLSTKLAVRAGLTIGQLTGDDENFDELEGRGWSFESNTFAVNAGLEYTFLAKERYDAGGTFQKTVSPYAFVMLGITSSDAEVSGLTQTQEEMDAGTVFFGIPVGLGVKLDLSERLTFGAEASTVLVFSDYLDGISESANPDKNDAYFTAGVSLTYRLGEGNDNSAGNN